MRSRVSSIRRHNIAKVTSGLELEAVGLPAIAEGLCLEILALASKVAPRRRRN
jgi:hypothetical protein